MELFEALSVIDSNIKREPRAFRDIDELPLSTLQKRCVLEWFAFNVLKMTDCLDLCSKHYDPMFIEDREAHSYAFNLENGGRHHSYTSLKHLESMILDEGKKLINYEF